MRSAAVVWIIMHRTIIIAVISLLWTDLLMADESALAPDWTLRSASGDAVTLSEAVADQPVIVLFWATWCPYCKALMPHIQSIRLEYGDRVRVLAVHFRDDEGDPVAFVTNRGYDFTVLPDGEEVARRNGLWSTPGVLIVDRARKIRFNLYALPPPELPVDDEAPSHSRKAAYLAPYWAAEMRKRLDLVLGE